LLTYLLILQFSGREAPLTYSGDFAFKNVLEFVQNKGVKSEL